MSRTSYLLDEAKRKLRLAVLELAKEEAFEEACGVLAALKNIAEAEQSRFGKRNPL